MPLILRRFVTFVATVCLAGAAYPSSLWFSDAAGVHRIETDTNAVAQDIAQPGGVVALTLDQKDGSLWALTASQLIKYDAAGSILVAVDLKTLSGNFNAARRLALDPSDDSIWVAGGNNAFHLDAGGRTLASVTSNDVVQDIALTQDETLWILSRNALSRYSPQGALLATSSLSGSMQQAVFLVADDANGVLWLAGNKSVFQVAIALPVQVRLAPETSEVVSGIALDAGSGSLWVAGQSSIFGFTKDGTPFASTDLSHQNLGNFQALDFDAQSQSLWLGHQGGISRFTPAGQFLATLPASVKTTAIGAAPSGISPIVTLVSPPNGALLRDAFAPIRLHYDASCFGQPCNFPPSVFAAYTLTATLNGLSIGGAFAFDPATNDAVYTPSAREAEGLNTFTAFVTDSSGRRSRTISSQFTIDTVAPRFLSLNPPDGSSFTSPGITLQGTIDDPAGRVLLESFSGATFTGPNPQQGTSFSYGVTLAGGTNSFRLTASDPAGNAAPLSFSYSFSTLTITIASPANNATIDDDKVTVTGSFTGAATATITVNGIPAAVTGTAFTAADVPLNFGTNTITVSGTSPTGAHDTKSITVDSIAPAIAIASPGDNDAVDGQSVFVTGRALAPPNSGVKVNHVTAALDGAGNFFAVVPVVQGANTVTATVTTPSGKSAARSVTVNASGEPPAFGVSAQPATGLAPLATVVTVSNHTGQDGVFTFFGSGPFALPANSHVALSLTLPAGVYTPTTVFVDGAGNQSSQTIVLEAFDASQIDQRLRAMWSGFTSALATGDKTRAMSFLNSGAQAKYGPVFDALMTGFPAIVASFSAPAASSLDADVAGYVIKRVSGGTSRAYFVYFVRGADGVWRIDEM